MNNLPTSPGLGDGPAQAIIEKNRNSRLKRNVEETTEELANISNRVTETLYNYENLTDFEPINGQGRSNSCFSYRGSIDSTLQFVDDMSDLVELLSDPVMKRKYQQSVAIFVVGYESLCGNRLQLLSQINDSLYNYKSQPVPELEDPEFDMDHVGKTVKKTIIKAMEVQSKLKDIGQNVASVLNKLNTERRKHSKKKTEKELVQTKEQILSITEKLMAAQEEVEHTNEKINHAYRNLEIKQVEIERLKAQIDASKKKSQDYEALRKEFDEKDKEIQELIKQNDKLNLVITQHKQKQEHLEQAYHESKAKQKKLEKDRKLHEDFMEQQMMLMKKETEKFYENQLKELKTSKENELDQEKVISKKKLASMDATIRELRADLTKLKKAKEDAINNILTQQAQKEVSEQNNSFNDSVERIVRYEKELKASHDKNKELENKLKEEEEKRKTKKKKEKKKSSKQQDSIQAASTTATTTTVQVQTESTGVHAELPDAASSVPPSTCESLSVVEAFEKSNSEVVSTGTSDDLLSELADVKSKYNQKLLLVTKLMEGQDKFMKERAELLQQVEMATNIKEDIEKELQNAMMELEKVRLLYEEANARQPNINKLEIDTIENGMMTSPVPDDEKPTRYVSAQTSTVQLPAAQATSSSSSIVALQGEIDNDEKPAVKGEVENHRLSSAAAAKSRASSVSSLARYRILESCLRSHPMVTNIRESYDNILQLKDEVATMLENEDDCKDCEKIVKQIPLEELRDEDSEDGNMADLILKMAVNSTRILTTLQQVIPSFMGRDDVLYYNQSTANTPIPDKHPDSSISVRVVNRSTTITLPYLQDKQTQKGGKSRIDSSASTINSHGRLADDYKALVYKHNDLEQDFMNLKKQFESRNRAHEHILANNASTIQEMEGTIFDLRNQLKETLHTNYKDEEFIFTRADVEYNESTLRQRLRTDQVDESIMEEAKIAMKEYTSIPVQRWAHLVRRFLHHVRIKSIQKYLESPQYNLRVVINQMHLLERQRSERHFMKSAELTRERIRLAKILIDRLETIESKTGVFLIKPIPTIRSLESDVAIEKQSPRQHSRKTHVSIPGPNQVLSKGISLGQRGSNQPLWKPTFSTVNTENLPRPEVFDGGQIRIPRLLEIDVNRSMYSENHISTKMPGNIYTKNKDHQLNLISYMTVERPGGMGNLDGPAGSIIDSDECSVTTSIKRPTSLPALKSRLSLVTEEALIDHYRRSVSTWSSVGGRKVTQSPMIQY